MTTAQQIQIAALAEVGYDAQPHPNGRAVVTFGAPCDIRWKASSIARQSVGEPPLTFEEWHKLGVEKYANFGCLCGGDR